MQRKMSPGMGNADSGPLQLQGIAYCVNMCIFGAVIPPKMKMRRPIKVAVLATVAVITLVSCGRTSSLAVQDNSFKAMLASLDWGKDTCYVYGHKTPDADAVCSSLAYAELMRSLGYNCVAKVSGKTNNETNFISSFFGFETPALKTSVAPGTRLIVTDHEEYLQSVEGARDSRLLQIIDHHQESDMASPRVPFIRREMVGSTCTLVWELYNEAGVPLSDDVARILLAGILSDTHNLEKANTTHKDSLAWFSLTGQLRLSPDSVAVISRAMDEALSDFDGMSDYDIFVSDYKDYDMSGVPVGIGYIEWRDYDIMDAFIDRMLATMPGAMLEKGREMVFCIITRYAPNPDPASLQKELQIGTYVLYCGEGTRQIAEQAFGASLRDGVCYKEGRLGRKGDVVPPLTALIGK